MLERMGLQPEVLLLTAAADWSMLRTIKMLDCFRASPPSRRGAPSFHQLTRRHRYALRPPRTDGGWIVEVSEIHQLVHGQEPVGVCRWPNGSIRPNITSAIRIPI